MDAIKRLLRHAGNRDMGVNYSRQTQGALSLNERTLGLFPVIQEKMCSKDSSFITGRILIKGTQYDTASFRMPFQQAYNCRFCIHHS